MPDPKKLPPEPSGAPDADTVPQFAVCEKCGRQYPIRRGYCDHEARSPVPKWDPNTHHGGRDG